MNDSFGGNGGGGGKKFLYTGPKKKSVFGDDDVAPAQQNWSYNTNTHNNTQTNYASSAEFDLDEIWSIKKNVNIQKVPTQQQQVKTISLDNPDRNVGKGFYSRHGGMGSGNSALRTAASPGTNPSGKTWPRTYNYSYGSNSNADKPKIGSPTTNRDFVKMGSMHSAQAINDMLTQTGIANSKNGVHKGTSPNAKHFDF